MKKDVELRKVEKFLKEKGFLLYRGGNHLKFRNDVGQTMTIPNHKILKGSTIKSSFRIVGLDSNEL